MCCLLGLTEAASEKLHAQIETIPSSETIWMTGELTIGHK